MVKKQRFPSCFDAFDEAVIPPITKYGGILNDTGFKLTTTSNFRFGHEGRSPNILTKQRTGQSGPTTLQPLYPEEIITLEKKH